MVPAAKRYYAEIMMPFRNSIKGYLEKVRALDPAIICPSHGPLHDEPDVVLAAYDDWVSDEVKNEVVIGYVSMHGSTKVMVDRLVDALIDRGVGVRQFHLTATDLGELAMALVDAATIVIATPTVLFGPHPAVIEATFLANALRAEGAVRDRDDELRLGRQDRRDLEGDARSPQGRVPRAGPGERLPVARGPGGDRGPRGRDPRPARGLDGRFRQARPDPFFLRGPVADRGRFAPPLSRE